MYTHIQKHKQHRKCSGKFLKVDGYILFISKNTILNISVLWELNKNYLKQGNNKAIDKLKLHLTSLGIIC